MLTLVQLCFLVAGFHFLHLNKGMKVLFPSCLALAHSIHSFMLYSTPNQDHHTKKKNSVSSHKKIHCANGSMHAEKLKDFRKVKTLKTQGTW